MSSKREREQPPKIAFYHFRGGDPRPAGNAGDAQHLSPQSSGDRDGSEQLPFVLLYENESHVFVRNQFRKL